MLNCSRRHLFRAHDTAQTAHRPFPSLPIPVGQCVDNLLMDSPYTYPSRVAAGWGGGLVH